MEHIAVLLGVEEHISCSWVVEEHISVSLGLGVEEHISVSGRVEDTSQYPGHVLRARARSPFDYLYMFTMPQIIITENFAMFSRLCRKRQEKGHPGYGIGVHAVNQPQDGCLVFSSKLVNLINKYSGDYEPGGHDKTLPVYFF